MADLNRVTVLALLGGITGVLLGQSRFTTKASFWLGVILSFEFLSWQVVFNTQVNLTWAQKGIFFIDRVLNAIHQIIINEPLQDGILFLVSMAILFWFLGFGSGFYLTRKGKPWLGITVAGSVIFIIQLFQTAYLRSYFLAALFCFLFFVLNARIKYLTAQKDREKKIHLKTRIPFQPFFELLSFLYLPWSFLPGVRL